MVAGFTDGVVRILTVSQMPEDIPRNKKGECEVALKQVFKPHSKAVTSMAYDGKGQILATGVSILLACPGNFSGSSIHQHISNKDI